MIFTYIASPTLYDFLDFLPINRFCLDLYSYQSLLRVLTWTKPSTFSSDISTKKPYVCTDKTVSYTHLTLPTNDRV